MSERSVKKHRGFVMTGGGAKGLYEAGVIHAFHLTGMEFDVITGSSIGAMNSIFYAEYLFCKKMLSDQILNDPIETIKQMDERMKAFHHAWLTMPDKQVINDGPDSPLAKLKDDLLRFHVTLPQLIAILWWMTDPDRKKLPPPRLWPQVLRLLSELAERLGPAEILRIFKNHRHNLLREALRTYLAKFFLEYAIVPTEEEYKIRDVFTSPISPLRPEHLVGRLDAADLVGTPLFQLVHPERTLKEYANAGIHVRLTRANFRTGRLEISSYVTPEEFASFLDKHLWRISVFGPDKLPLGSFRLKVPGNPLALNAAICSGRFPGVFRPYRLEDIYPEKDEENKILYSLLREWLDGEEVVSKLQPEIVRLNPKMGSRNWEQWRSSVNMRKFFPTLRDTYVDGGAIDNTPYTAAVDYVRDNLQKNKGSVRDETLELYVVYLSTEPKVDYYDRPIASEEPSDPLIFEVVSRTLELVGAAGESGSATTFDTINSFGKRGEQIADVLELVLDSYKKTLDGLDPDRRRQAEQDLLNRVRKLNPAAFKSPDGILEMVREWTEKNYVNRLPLHVETVKIYPEKMPLNTLQFTERLGYKKENAIQMLAMGCYATLDSLRTRLEERVNKNQKLDEHDERALGLVRKWTGELWQSPSGPAAEDRPVWQCQWTACALNASACPHGARARQPAAQESGSRIR